MLINNKATIKAQEIPEADRRDLARMIRYAKDHRLFVELADFELAGVSPRRAMVLAKRYPAIETTTSVWRLEYQPSDYYASRGGPFGRLNNFRAHYSPAAILFSGGSK